MNFTKELQFNRCYQISLRVLVSHENIRNHYFIDMFGTVKTVMDGRGDFELLSESNATVQSATPTPRATF